MMMLKDLFNDIFDALYGEHYDLEDSNVGELSEYYCYECKELEKTLRIFYINVNDIIRINTEDIMKQLINWEYCVGFGINVDNEKLRDVSERILELLNEEYDSNV